MSEEKEWKSRTYVMTKDGLFCYEEGEWQKVEAEVELDIPENVIIWTKAVQYVMQELGCTYEIALEVMRGALRP